jgi:L-threonylcarbamoyladenylate synthase
MGTLVPRIIKFNSPSVNANILNEVAQGIRDGKSVIFPTSGLYGLGVDATNEQAVERIFEIKKRAAEKPILLLIHDFTALDKIAASVPATAQTLIDHFWPGDLTLVLPAQASVLKPLTAGTGKIGVRQSAHPVARTLIKTLGRPITGTSANISGSPGYISVADMPRELIATVDWVIDAGPVTGGMGSTVVDVTTSPPQILREGRISMGALQAVITD